MSRAALAQEQLLRAAAALGPGALLPAWQEAGAGGAAARRDAEAALAELLSLSAPPGGQRHSLEGAWTLVYASRGTVVTRALQPPAALARLLPSLAAVSDVMQTLTRAPGPPGTLAADNAACVDLGLLGRWRLRAVGSWTALPEAQAGAHGAGLVAFSALALEALEGRLPPLRLPLPPPLAERGATFRTLYLDARLRVAEGALSGGRFVFTRVLAAPPSSVSSTNVV